MLLSEFKKQKEKSIELVVPPTIIPDQKENYIQDIIKPTMEKQPAWWKKIRTELYKGKNNYNLIFTNNSSLTRFPYTSSFWKRNW